MKKEKRKGEKSRERRFEQHVKAGERKWKKTERMYRKKVNSTFFLLGE